MRGIGARARVVMWGLVVGAAAAVLAPVGPGALVPLKMAIASADAVGNDVYVAVVVDFGNGSSMSMVQKCVPVASNAHDADALAAAVGSGNVAYNNSGLLCSINDYPANGVQNCGQSVGNGNYDYWSYWHGSSGSWVYASNGPGEQSVSSPADDVEGLRFQSNEPASSSDPPPSGTPSYAQICNASTEVPPAQTPSAPVTTTTTPRAGAPAATPTTVKAGTGGSSPVSTTGTAVITGARSSGAGAPTTTSAPGATTTTSAAGASTGRSDGNRGSSSTHRSTVAVAAASSHKRSSGAPPTSFLPVVLIVVVVAALGGFALFRWRRRPAEE